MRLRGRVVGLFVLLAPGTALAEPTDTEPHASALVALGQPDKDVLRGDRAATEEDARRHDHFFTISPAVPLAGRIRVDMRAGIDRSEEDGSAVTPTATVLVLGSLGAGFALEGSALLRAGEASPGAAVRYQFLRQERYGLDATFAVRYGSFGLERPDIGGGELGGELAVGRRLGRVMLAATGLVGRGIVDRDDVDGVFAASALVQIVDALHVGVEGRARTELVDNYDTEEDHGRSFELTGGGVGMIRVGTLTFQVMMGWQAPRGLVAPGPVGLGGAAVDF